MNADRIKAILADTDFLAVVEKTRQSLTKKVMAKGTSDEDRQEALSTYHCLDILIAQIRSEAQNSKENSHE